MFPWLYVVCTRSLLFSLLFTASAFGGAATARAAMERWRRCVAPRRRTGATVGAAAPCFDDSMLMLRVAVAMCCAVLLAIGARLLRDAKVVQSAATQPCHKVMSHAMTRCERFDEYGQPHGIVIPAQRLVRA